MAALDDGKKKKFDDGGTIFDKKRRHFEVLVS